MLIQDAHEDMMKDAREIILDIQKDENGVNHAELRGWFAELEDVEADYMIVDDYLELGQYNTAMNFLNTIPDIYTLVPAQLDEYISMHKYIEWRIAIKNNGKSIQNADLNQQVALQLIADEGSGIAVCKAQNILNYFYEANYRDIPVMAGNNTQRRSNNIGRPLDRELMESYLKIYPNPAKDLTALEYTLPCISKTAILQIADPAGKILFSKELHDAHNIILLDIKNWNNGNYIYTLACDGITIANGKLNVTK